MNSFKYKFTSNKVKKIDCAFCGAKQHWQRYFNTETGEVLPDRFGLCDNTQKCGAKLSPYSQNSLLGIEEGYNNTYVSLIKGEQYGVIPNEVLKLTLNNYEENCFIQNLFYNVPFVFEKRDVEEVIEVYYLGTVVGDIRNGAITFPFINEEGEVRAIQEKLFDKDNHTIKAKYSQGFIHSRLLQKYKSIKQILPGWLVGYQKVESKVSCLFGEHLLTKYPNKKIALVEAPKTAIYGALYFGLPSDDESMIWLAVFNKSSFNNMDKIKVLEGREVIVFPDLSNNGITFNEWKNRSGFYESALSNTRFIVSSLLEEYATIESRLEGEDLADYLIKQDWRRFRGSKLSNGLKRFVKPQYSKSNPVRHLNCDFLKEKPKVIEMIPVWFTELEDFFKGKELPKVLALSNYEIINDVQTFVDTHLSFVKRNIQCAIVRPYVDRLLMVRDLCEL